MSQSVGEILYLAIDHHPPEKVSGRKVTCMCGWRGERYLEHIAEVADRDLATSRYTLADREGREVPAGSQ